LRRYKAPSIAQIPSEWIQSGDKIICSDINWLFITNKCTNIDFNLKY
jgi:hypothetical protein